MTFFDRIKSHIPKDKEAKTEALSLAFSTIWSFAAIYGLTGKLYAGIGGAAYVYSIIQTFKQIEGDVRTSHTIRS